eukprot:gnl/MRDRNA2_/MRDRNA2_112270_c0_seq1.p1 gnl/MRDRNA2_/MRDRNA2_112270_c0~~gnl/MRDRNA2_/MRDRNA2_112270_c0_seq1.p1  ORF type:complete len:196 (+),score=60.58 gnl/MRDRNA2_/MRDRNA2_112270_c0_seq1:104-691(+)
MGLFSFLPPAVDDFLSTPTGMCAIAVSFVVILITALVMGRRGSRGPSKKTLKKKEKKKASAEDAPKKETSAQAPAKVEKKAEEPIPIGKKKKAAKPSEEEIKEQRDAKAAEKARRKADREATLAKQAESKTASEGSSTTNGTSKKANGKLPDNYPVEEGWDLVTKPGKKDTKKNKKTEESSGPSMSVTNRFGALE